MSTLDDSEMHTQCDRTISRLGRENDELHAVMRRAIDELRRWQYSSDPEEIRHSIDMAVSMLQKA